MLAAATCSPPRCDALATRRNTLAAWRDTLAARRDSVAARRGKLSRRAHRSSWVFISATNNPHSPRIPYLPPPPPLVLTVLLERRAHGERRRRRPCCRRDSLAADAGPLRAPRAVRHHVSPPSDLLSTISRFPYLSSRHSIRPSPFARRAQGGRRRRRPCRRRALRSRALRRPAPLVACLGFLVTVRALHHRTTCHMPRPRGRSTATASHRDCATPAPLPHTRSLLLRAAARVGSRLLPTHFSSRATLTTFTIFWPPRAASAATRAATTLAAPALLRPMMPARSPVRRGLRSARKCPSSLFLSPRRSLPALATCRASRLGTGRSTALLAAKARAGHSQSKNIGPESGAAALCRRARARVRNMEGETSRCWG